VSFVIIIVAGAVTLQCLAPQSLLRPHYNSGTWFLPICQNQIQGLFKDFQGPYKNILKKTELNQTALL